MIKISIIIPVYNEEATLLELLRSASDQNIDDVEFEIIVIDDGSSDNTPKLLAENEHLYNEVLTLSENAGKGAAVKKGMSTATGDYILFQDSDLEYNPIDYERLIMPIKEFSAEIVIGSRFSAPPYTRVQYFWHKIGNQLITLIFNVLNNTTFTDIYSCYLVYKRDLFDADLLVVDGWGQQAEILSRAVKSAKVLYEVPIRYRGRGYGDGKKIKAFDTIAVIWAIFRYRF